MTDNGRNDGEGDRDYRQYVIQDGEFIGEFEEMYQRCDDPWRCNENAESFPNDLFLTLAKRSSSDGATVLDVGCGEGPLTARLAGELEGADVIGVDISSTAVEEARRRHDEPDFATLDIRSEDPSPLVEGDFDVVTMAQLLWYVLEDLDEVFFQVHRSLAEDGSLVILQYFLSPDDQEYGNEIMETHEDLREHLRVAGFTVVEEAWTAVERPLGYLVRAGK